MPRLGEMLVAAGLLTAEQVERALRAQVMWGGRLGTNLIELHYLELDPLSKSLGNQHHLPAALARHFEKADPELQRMLPPEVAEQCSCVPLFRMGPEQHVAIASLAPLSAKQLAILARELAVDVRRLVPSIAAELRIRYQLERVYQIRRAARFLRARGKSIPPFPVFSALSVPQPEPELDLPPISLPTTTQEIAVYRPPGALAGAELPASEEDTLDDLLPIKVAASPETDGLDDLSHQVAFDDDLAIPIESIEDEVTARQRRKYVQTIADAPPPAAEPPGLIGRIAIRKVAIGSAPRVMAGATLGEATRAIRRSTSRDRIADLVIDTLERFVPACEAAILLVVRGATAIGWKGFQRGGLLGEIAVPMEDGGLVPRAIEGNLTLRKPCAELEPIDQLLLASLGRHTGDLVVVPIAIADKVMCVIAIAAVTGTLLISTEPIAEAAGAAFARLMRDASR
jgi:Type II secretion system (T2SS), protein E, N-terminal domain